MTSMPSEPVKRFDTLDLLRGIAAMAVMTLHVPRIEGTEPLFPHAYLAVDLFFALSGFVIAHAYSQRLSDGEPVSRFMMRRLIRLYPLYAVGAVAGAVLLAAGLLPGGSQVRSPHELVVAIAANFFFLPAPSEHAGATAALFPALFPAWSLFWELIANFLFALLLPRLTSRLLIAIVGLGLVTLVGTGIVFGSLDAGPLWSNYWGGGGRVLWSYFAGVALERAYVRMRPGPVLPGWLLGILLLGSLMEPKSGGAYDIAAAVLLPALVLLGVQNSRPSRIGHWLGYVSYAVYVLHVPLITVLNNLTEWVTGEQLEARPLLLVVPVCWALTLAFAFAATRGFDDHARAWLTRKLFRGGRVSAAATA